MVFVDLKNDKYLIFKDYIDIFIYCLSNFYVPSFMWGIILSIQLLELFNYDKRINIGFIARKTYFQNIYVINFN